MTQIIKEFWEDLSPNFFMMLLRCFSTVRGEQSRISATCEEDSPSFISRTTSFSVSLNLFKFEEAPLFLCSLLLIISQPIIFIFLLQITYRRRLDIAHIYRSLNNPKFISKTSVAPSIESNNHFFDTAGIIGDWSKLGISPNGNIYC